MGFNSRFKGLEFYIFCLCGDINFQHKISYQLFLIISARNICSIREHFENIFLKFTDYAVNINS